MTHTKKMKCCQQVILLLAALLPYNLPAQDGLLGIWKTMDDDGKVEKSIIQIEEQGEFFLATITDLLDLEPGETNPVCSKCKGKRKNQPIRGLQIFENMRAVDTGKWRGKILDPENGKLYNCYLELEENAKLKVRGYFGIPALGRTQYWYRDK